MWWRGKERRQRFGRVRKKRSVDEKEWKRKRKARDVDAKEEDVESRGLDGKESQNKELSMERKRKTETLITFCATVKRKEEPEKWN